jgi:peptidylprolyl isomerase
VIPPATPAAISAPATAWRAVDPDLALVIDTNRGRIVVVMEPRAAPAHVARIQRLAHEHFYDGQTFFRVIGPFMDQTGDPENKGDEGGSRYGPLKAEFTFKRPTEGGRAAMFAAVRRPMGGVDGLVGVLPVHSQADALGALHPDRTVTAWGAYCPGVAGMARDEGPDTADSQFFLMREAYPSLEGRYTAWGRVVQGLDVVRAIKTGEPVPPPQDRMLTVRLLSDLPDATRPRVEVLDPAAPAFAAAVRRARQARGADFSVCDAPVPARVSP